MYSRKTKIFFGAMVFIMGIGYPLSLVSSFPAFQGLFGGQTGNATQKLVDEAKVKVRDGKCGATGKGKPGGKQLTKCKRALEDLGSGYQALAQPEDGATEQPPNAERNLEKSLEAFELLYQLDPKDEDSSRFLASAYQQQGKSELALPLLRELAKENPEDPDFTYAWASAAQGASKNEEAIKAFKVFLKMAPDDQRAEFATAAIDSMKNGGAAGAGAAGAASNTINVPTG